MLIEVFIQSEKVIKHVAPLIHMDEQRLKDLFKSAQFDGRPCIVKAKVTTDEWDYIKQKYPFEITKSYEEIMAS